MTDSQSNLIFIKNSNSSLTEDQKTFNRLTAKIKKLQDDQAFFSNKLEEALQFFYKTMGPELEAYRTAHVEYIKSCYQFYKTSTCFSQKELEIFKEWLIEKISQICNDYKPMQIPNDIKDIFHELHQQSYEEAMSQEIKSFQSSIREYFNDVNLDKIFSEINWNAPRGDIMQYIMHALGESESEMEKNIPDQDMEDHPKTKTQQKKESTRQTLQKLQQKGIGDIYKQLAKVLHPDLEQDPVQKAAKEELMKKVTGAYKNNDMYTLLQLKIKWVSQSIDHLQSQNNEQLKIYNNILTKQVKEARLALNELIQEPRFTPIASFYPEGFTSIFVMNIAHNELKHEIKTIQKITQNIETSDSQKMFKKMLKEFSKSMSFAQVLK